MQKQQQIVLSWNEVSNQIPNLLLQLFPKPWTVDTFVKVFLSQIQKTLDYEMKMQICAVSHFLFLIADFLRTTLFNLFPVLHMPRFVRVIWGSMSGTGCNALNRLVVIVVVMHDRKRLQSISQNAFYTRYQVSFKVITIRHSVD